MTMGTTRFVLVQMTNHPAWDRKDNPDICMLCEGKEKPIESFFFSSDTNGYAHPKCIERFEAMVKRVGTLNYLVTKLWDNISQGGMWEPGVDRILGATQAILESLCGDLQWKGLTTI